MTKWRTSPANGEKWKYAGYSLDVTPWGLGAQNGQESPVTRGNSDRGIQLMERGVGSGCSLFNCKKKKRRQRRWRRKWHVRPPKQKRKENATCSVYVTNSEFGRVAPTAEEEQNEPRQKPRSAHGTLDWLQLSGGIRCWNDNVLLVGLAQRRLKEPESLCLKPCWMSFGPKVRINYR